MRSIASSAAYRVAFAYASAFALAILVLGSAVYLVADLEFRRQQDAGIAEESALLVREYREGGMRDLSDAIGKRDAGATKNGYRYALFDTQGKHVAGALNLVAPRSGTLDLRVRQVAGPIVPARALVTALPGGSRLLVAADLEALSRIDRTILELFSGAFLLIVVLGAAGALLLGSYLRNRLERINATATAIVAGNLDRRVPVSGRGDEFDELGVALNAMLDRIVLLLENLRQVSSDVAHDLRTPLARLRGQVEAALDSETNPAAHRQALKGALAQSDNLLSLFAAILRIAEIESGTLRRQFAPVDLSEVVRDLCDSYGPAVADQGRTLNCAIEPDVRISGDRELIAQALVNLLDNAQRHTPIATEISVLLTSGGSTATVTVADNGPGVPESDHARIVQRFARRDTSRTTPGHGLGLNLASAIAAAHEGRLRFEDNRPGLCAHLALPRQAA